MKTIAPAFVKAKKAFGPALKQNVNPHFRSKYADLSVCIEAVDDALLANGIAMFQETFEDTAGVTVETVFLHESGEMMRCGKLHVPAAKNDAQAYGSALSYARRYSLMAACGIAAQDDDDGNAASKQAPAPTQRDDSPPARAARLKAGVADGDAEGAAKAVAGWPQEVVDAVWPLLDEQTAEQLTRNWPKG